MSGGGELVGRWRAQDLGESPLRDDVALELGPLHSTRMAGPEPAMRQEREFLTALSGRRSFAIDGEALVIGQGPEQVRLLRVDEAPWAAT
jgi:heat shock protein HslJ